MDLLNKTDFEILEVLGEGGRNVAPNIAEEIDASRGYINTRFQTLVAYDLVKKVGPSSNSGLYEITDQGRMAVEHKQAFLDDEIEYDFEEFLQTQINNQ